MTQQLYNLHNHTPFSDGAYTIDELCEAHLDLDTHVDGIGISDHLFATPSSREVKSEREFERLFAAEKDAYVKEVAAARERWASRLRIFCGAEINWPLNKAMLPAILRNLEGIDYVLIEYPDWAGLTTLANQARRFPCPVGLAHADVSEQFPNTSMDQVVRTMANARLFYEVSSKFGDLQLDHPWFRLLPNHRVRVSIGTDTHDDLTVLSDIGKLAQFIEGVGLGEKYFVPSVAERKAAAS